MTGRNRYPALPIPTTNRDRPAAGHDRPENPIAPPNASQAAAAWLSPAEFAALLRVPVRTVSWLCQRRRLPGSHRIGRRWRIDLDEYRSATAIRSPASPPETAHDGELLDQVLARVHGRR